MVRPRVLPVLAATVALAGCIVPCVIGVVLRPGAGSTLSERATFHQWTPWLAVPIVASFMAAWLLLATAFVEWRIQRRRSRLRVRG